MLGLTNYSHDPSAALLRGCLRSDPGAQHAALDLAKERLRGMLHVGVFERLHASLGTLAGATARDIDAPTWKSDTANAFSYDVSDGESEGEVREGRSGQRFFVSGTGGAR